MSDNTKADMAVNEFNQVMKPVSLWADAWKRLRKNRMALISLWVVGTYFVVTLFAPLLTSAGIIHSYKEQVMLHANLRPSFKPAGELVLERIQGRIAQIEGALTARGTPIPAEGEAVAGGAAEATATTEAAATTPTSEAPAFSFDFGAPVEEGDEAALEGGETGEEAPAEFALNFGGGGTDTTSTQDPLLNELQYQRSDLAKIKEEIESNPVHGNMYLLGTDDLGRDMVARIIYGGRISIAIGIVGTLTAALVGIVYGAIAGYLGGKLDNYMMRFVDVMYGLPYMLIVIIIMAMVGEAARGSFVVLFVAIALVSWLTIARVVRGQVISLKNSEFVEAARSMGASPARVIFRHLLPNTLGVIIVFSTLLMPSFIMNESFLSFLGLGVSAPDASWGTLVSEGVRAMEVRVWQLLGPAIAMTLFLFCMNFLGDGVRDALDPQSKNRT